MKAVFTSVFFVLVFLGSRSETLVQKVMLDEYRSTVLVVTFAKHHNGQEEIRKCQLISDSDEIQAVLQSTPYSDVQQATNEEIQDAIDDCSAYADSKRPTEEEDGFAKDADTEALPEQSDSDTTEGYSGVAVVLPGTKWCGAGDRAKQIQDLGFWEDTDHCCRAHDLCDDTLAPGETKHNLTNKSTFTKLNCQCDHEFYECLQKVDSLVSNSIGNLYFNVLRRGCYEYDHPVTKCKSYRTFLKITCREHEKDTSLPKVWQWVAPRKYTRIPLPLPPRTLTIDVDF